MRRGNWRKRSIRPSARPTAGPVTTGPASSNARLTRTRRQRETASLEGIKVVDVSQVAAVPLASRLLADFGADVIHVEHPLRGDSWREFQAGQGAGTAGAPSPINYNWENYNRNKRSLTLDLSQEQGREIMHRLLKDADVLLTNLRSFEKVKFGLEYSAVSKLNPRLVYASLFGYGKYGPDKDAPGYDQTAYWHRAGIPYVLSWPGELPPCFQTAFGDNVAALALAFGVMTALYRREKTGAGQEVDLSLFQMGVFVNAFNIGGALTTGKEYEEWRRHAPEESPNPLSNIYLTGDGRWLNMVMLQSDRYWTKFCQAIGHEEMEKDPRFDSFATRKENHVELFHVLEEIMLTKPLREWITVMTAAGLPIAPMQSLQEVIHDPQAEANNFFPTFDHPTYGPLKIIANPLNFSEDPATIRTPAPELGQHTEEVMLELGYDWEDIGKLKDDHII
ncbi:MAG: CoA transferase [Chloroflexota bacterium]